MIRVAGSESGIKRTDSVLHKKEESGKVAVPIAKMRNHSRTPVCAGHSRISLRIKSTRISPKIKKKGKKEGKKRLL